MNPTNESIGRALAPWPDFAGHPIHDMDRIRHPDGTTGTVLHLPKLRDAWRVVYEDGTLSRLNLQVGDKGMAVVIPRELDRQAPGVPDWQSVADQMAAAIAPGEWVMVPRELRKASDMWEAGVRARNRGGTVHDVWDAMIAAAPQPPAQEQGEVLVESDKDVAVAQAVEFAEYVVRAAKGSMVERAKHFLSLPYSQEIAERLTRAAGAEDARDAERYRWLRSDDRSPSDLNLWVAMGTYTTGISQWNGNSLDRQVDADIASQAQEGGRE